MEGFKHKDYDIFPAAQQLRNDDGSPGKWMPLASIVRWRAQEVLAVPVTWYPPGFDNEQEATTYAASAAMAMIDAGRCKI